MYITNLQRGDGFGGQFLNLIRAIVFTEVNGHIFVDTGINSMTIQDADQDPTYFSKIINYMNVNKFYLTPGDLPAGTQIHSLPNVIDFYHLYVNEFLKMENSDSFRRYKKIFLHDKTSPHDNNFYNVAIHIRRTEKYQLVINGISTANPDFSDSYYSKFCEKIRNEYKGNKPLRFHIYSLGKEDDFSFLKGNDIVFHLNEDLIQTHLGFIFADILLISHSCLSYSAAFFSKGTIYYRNWNHLHLGLPSWIRYD
jgi:hypothetical protein